MTHANEWQVHVQADWQRAGVDVVWHRQLADGSREISNGSIGWRVAPDQAAVNDPNIEPLRLQEDMLRALHQALLKHFDGADDTRMLRKDYDAERARVDKLIGAWIEAR